MPTLNVSRTPWALMLTTVLATTACQSTGGGSSSDDPSLRTLEVCGTEISEAEMSSFLEGNVVIVADVAEDGSSNAAALGDLAVSLVANGIDFGDLGSARPSYSEGAYSLTTGTSTLGFRLFYAEDFGDAVAGTPVPHNIFDPDSYAQNVSVDLDTSVFPPIVSVDYDPGPLAGLVEGDISVDETSLSLRLDLRVDLLDIEVDSRSERQDAWNAGDTLDLRMTTTRLNLALLAGDLETAGVGFSYDETRYQSPAGSLEQSFFDSLFTTVRRTDGNYDWEGAYSASVAKEGLTMYQLGWVSTQGGNTTEYYCDQAQTQRVGIAEHDDSLEGGVFLLDDGGEVEYGLW